MERFRHVGIVVGDLDQAVKWYSQFDYYPLNYETVEIAGKAVQLCKLVHREGTTMELLDGSSAVPHVSFTVNHLEFEHLKEAGAELFEKEGVLYIKDPWDNIIEIVEEL